MRRAATLPANALLQSQRVEPICVMTWLRLCIYQCDEWPFVHKPKGGPGWRQWICSAQSTGWQETKPLLLNYHKCFATCVLCLKGCTKASKFIISTAQPIGFGLNHAKSMAICPSGPAPRGNASVKTEPWISLCYDLRLESIAQDSQDEPIKWMASCSLETEISLGGPRDFCRVYSYILISK